MIVRIKAVPGQPTIALQKATVPDYYESIIYVNQIIKKEEYREVTSHVTGLNYRGGNGRLMLPGAAFMNQQSLARGDEAANK